VGRPDSDFFFWNYLHFPVRTRKVQEAALLDSIAQKHRKANFTDAEKLMAGREGLLHQLTLVDDPSDLKY
jgi:hypothetical protein